MIGHRPPDVADERTRVLADVAGALAVHVEDRGFCRGFVTTRAQPFPCTRVVSAQSVQANLGGSDGAAVVGRGE